VFYCAASSGFLWALEKKNASILIQYSSPCSLPNPVSFGTLEKRQQYEVGRGLLVVGYEFQSLRSVAYPGILTEVGSTNSVEDRGQRERRSGGGNPLVRGSVGSCNLVK
jgi:hypothetical protein